MKTLLLALRMPTPSAHPRVALRAGSLVLTALLAGCAADGAPLPPPVNIVSDNYCAVSRKVSWDVDDTRQTIDEARRHNSRIDKLCPPASAARTSPAVPVS